MWFQMIEPIKVGVYLLFHYCVSKFQNFRGLEKAGNLSILFLNFPQTIYFQSKDCKENEIKHRTNFVRASTEL